MWEPVVGVYQPSYKQVLPNTYEKLLKINKEEDKTAKQRIQTINRSKTTLCDRFFKKQMDKSLLHIFKAREQNVKDQQAELDDAKKDLKPIAIPKKSARS